MSSSPSIRPLSTITVPADAFTLAPAVKAVFSPAVGVLSVFGNDDANTLTVSRNAAGAILVNGGAVTPTGGTPTVANTALMQLFGQGGNDVMTLDESNGALPAALMFGGAGNDTMTAGSGADQLFGQSGNDTLLGKGGNDLLFGGDGNDVLTGGDGDDQMFGQGGDDRFVWNPGDDTDLNEGGDGFDTSEVNGGNGAETFTITANGLRTRIDRVTPAPFSIDAGTIEQIVINANGGDDIVNAANLPATQAKLVLDGGAGNDTITGGQGADTLLGGDGNDSINGGRGNDVAFLGAGDDSFVWNPGDGSDTVEGQGGTDTLAFNGANIAESIDIAANGGRVRFFRDVANVTMDLNDVERIDFKALGGADRIVVNDLSGTDVRQVAIDLSGAVAGLGDGAIDTVEVRGGSADEQITVAGAGTSATVTDGAVAVTLTGADATDLLTINGGAGNDTLSAAGLPAGVVQLTLDGGAGNDVLIGSQGRDTLIGGDGDDFIDGGRGDDVALMGTGNDVFVWAPGQGSDIVEGGDGNDTMDFAGANIGENIDIAANGERVRFFRDVANITMDLNDVEKIRFEALGGSDNVLVHDLSGTDAKQVEIDLAGAANPAAGDGAHDVVTVQGTANVDTIALALQDGALVVNGLPAQAAVQHFDAADDVHVQGLAGDDVIDASAVGAAGPQLTLEGGAGNDLLIGSAGNDAFQGGTGNDAALMGAGDDVFFWAPGEGSDIVEGQAGFDAMAFKGANIAESIDIAANGGRVRFFRDVANITMDLNDVEKIDFQALGGADNVVVHDLSGTDVQQVHVDLAGTPGGTAGDNVRDVVTLEGTAGSDAITLSLQNGALVVDGLASQVVIEHFDLGDEIRILGLGGDDIIDASGLGADGPGLRFEGGTGDDVLLGSGGADTLLGDAGDDVLLGNAGDDVLDGGAGDDVLIGGDGNDVLLDGEVAIQSLVMDPAPLLV